MHTTKKQLDPTNVQLTISVDAAELEPAKIAALKELAKDLKLAGFRKGHAPTAMVERVVDQRLLQNTVIDKALNEAYVSSINQEKLRPVGNPEVSITKFVPFTVLEIEAKVEVVGEIKLADYKKFKITKKLAPVSDQEVEAIIDDLLARDATKKEVKRAAATGDEVTIDFIGVDARSKKDISGAKGDDYPLVIGSNSFIPGFEPEIVGLKTDETKTFTVTFPKDYGAKELQNKKVEFTVKIKSVKERKLPKLDAAFVAKIGPFKTPAELRTDIRKQVGLEKDRQAQQQLESDLLQQLGEKTQVILPASMVEQELDRMDEEERRNLVYQGKTWQEHLKEEGKTDVDHREGHRSQAELRIRTGLALGEVAEREGIAVEQAEFEKRVAELKKQYTDVQMQAELSKPENQNDIASRILTEKTVAALVGYAAANN